MTTKEAKALLMNILIVEDHELTRFGLKTALEGDYGIREAGSAEEALEIFKNSTPDIVILDLGLPGMNGVEAAQKFRESGKDVKIIILTSHNDEKEVLECLKAGANAYCSKEINPKRLLEVVESVAEGAAWFDPAVAQIVLNAVNNVPQTSAQTKDYDFTSREVQILQFIAQGRSNQEIAEKLEISVNTTKAHVVNILRKLEVEDRLQAALKALKQNIV
jgi:DNA-binding NarL/FixJ family response regulator